MRTGKTTLISTLTGMIEATSGDALIYGCSLRYDLPAIRQMTGVWLVDFALRSHLFHLFFLANHHPYLLVHFVFASHLFVFATAHNTMFCTPH